MLMLPSRVIKRTEQDWSICKEYVDFGTGALLLRSFILKVKAGILKVSHCHQIVKVEEILDNHWLVSWLSISR